ncbi:RagB/SusD family nutrient uptake outer membrane protein [Chitinophaga arvensicola]|uniref:Starch-binding associating with outer membrane n=1 Tax=Chitinophaga arvensicola TaxID=29529 RepID=A0A1I0QZG4_9BACT|nr:RagB/SusD family nutrient uptake outer membrane protein [Chitinophaga arvensicola]SEW32538.1 Starch-binding associating with outer membrane [Chitinophaga arvensicola]
MNTMKLKIFPLFFILLVSACNKDYLTKLPLDKMTEATSFKTADNFKTYMQGCYEYFPYYNVDVPSGEYNSDNMVNGYNVSNKSPYAFQQKIIPTATSNSGWDFSFVRRVNIMLDNVDQSAMSQADKDHWRSVGYFFRALQYYDLIAMFGDVPWIEHKVTDTSTSILYGPRTPRDQVAKNMLDNLVWAEQHIKPEGDGANTVNVHVVRALLSRFGLFEGTWRRYHQLDDAATYLNACKTYSEKLLASFPAVMSSYDDVYNSEELVGKPGIILARQYIKGQTGQSATRYVRTSSWGSDLSKDAVDAYLCADGKPVSTTATGYADSTMNAEFRQRDRRLYYTVLPPYKVIASGQVLNFTRTNVPSDNEFIDFMATLPGNDATRKRLPVVNWAGYILYRAPHFLNDKTSGSQGFMNTSTGYYYYKPYNTFSDVSTVGVSTTDYPVYRTEEVMLNYAEVMWELGAFNQGIADLTINKLRPRAGLPNMVVANINGAFDTRRDPAVDPVLWEIRRERRVELMGDGFRFNDLKRWGKGEYFNKQLLGTKVKVSDYGAGTPITLNSNGQVVFYPVPVGWLNYYYLEPVPVEQIQLNPNLAQTPGWK